MNLMESPAIRSDKDNKKIPTLKEMKMDLINGTFPGEDARDILIEFIHVKIRFHERKIQRSSNEEDIKMREKRIKELQRMLFELRPYFENNRMVQLHAELSIR